MGRDHERDDGLERERGRGPADVLVEARRDEPHPFRPKLVPNPAPRATLADRFYERLRVRERDRVPKKRVADDRKAALLEHAGHALAIGGDARGRCLRPGLELTERLAEELERVAFRRRPEREDAHFAALPERGCPAPEHGSAVPHLPQPEGADDRVKRPTGRIGRIRLGADDVLEAGAIDLLPANRDQLFARIRCAHRAVLTDRARDRDHLCAEPGTRDENALSLRQRELLDEVEMIRDEPRYPLLQVARPRTVPRRSHRRGSIPRAPDDDKVAAMTRRTSLYERHVAAKGRMVPFAGWEMPIQYTGIVDEHVAVRTAAGIFDVSHMGELELSGEHAAAVVDYLVTNDTSKLVDGQALYTCACNEAGTILDDLIVYRAARDRWLIVCNASNREKMVAVFRRAAENHCTFEDRSDATALLALQGPKAFDVLDQAGSDAAKLRELKSFHFRDAIVANVRCTVARTGYTGEDGVEIFCAWNDAPALWDQLVLLGAKPIGLGARDTLRLEARLSLYGNDIDETTNPVEAGLAWVVKLDKPMFVGKEALAAIKAKELPRKLVGFEVEGRGVARHGYPLLDLEGNAVGVCTSGSPGPTVGKNIGLGYLPSAMTAIGTKFLVDCRGKHVEAVVVKTPFYKRATRI
jgi:aminomethyltransferase